MITVSDLSKRFGRTTAVDHLSFEVKPGTVTGFLGPNGSGKSTTMRCMLGLDRPDTGGASFDGRAYRQLSSPLHEVGALLDAKALHPSRGWRLPTACRGRGSTRCSTWWVCAPSVAAG